MPTEIATSTSLATPGQLNNPTEAKPTRIAGQEEQTPTRSSLLPELIATEQPVIHPALDWRDNSLLMGVRLEGGGRAVLTSNQGMLALDQLNWPICESARNFERSPVTAEVARRLSSGYGSPDNSESAYALVNVPGQLATYYRRFIVFSAPWWADVLALWTLGTYVYPIFDAYPYLRISSPEPGCGKSMLGQIISNLSFNGELMVSPTEANIFRMAESERGTQVWDEVENQSAGDQNRLQLMTSVLLNGYRSGGAVPRQERSGQGQFTTVRYHVYVPRVLIGLSALPQVVQQRCVELTLQRRSPEERIERYRLNERRDEEQSLRELCALYALSYCRHIAQHYRNDGFAERLEQYVGQAGRFADDLLLPLIALVSGAIDKDPRSSSVLLPTVHMLLREVAPILRHSWNESATTTPSWFSPTLDLLEQECEVTPADLARLVSIRAGTALSAEQLSRQLRRYGIRSVRNNGRRIFSVPTGQIDQLRRRYGLSSPD
jgi:hypothetical protein